MIISLCAPSGSGKSTMVKHLLETYPGQYELSISATTRAPRGQEQHGKEYYFISREEFERDHSGIAHGGFVIRTGKTGFEKENTHVIEYSLKLDSNPEFTASVIVAYARAAARLSQMGEHGCKTVLDIPPAMLSAQSGEELRRKLL